MIRYSDKSNLREKGLILATGQVHLAGMSWWQEREAASHCVHSQEAESNAYCFPTLFIYPMDPSKEMVPPTVGGAFYLS